MDAKPAPPGLWPAAPFYEHRTRAMVKRLGAWRAALDLCATAIKGMAAAEHAYATAYNRIGGLLQAKPNRYTVEPTPGEFATLYLGGQVDCAIDAIVQCCQAEAASHAHLSEYFDSRFTQSLASARTDVDELLNRVLVAIERQEPLLVELRAAAGKLVEQHFRQSQAFNAGEDGAPDPVVSEMQLKDALARLAAVEKDYFARMLDCNLRLFRLDDELSAMYRNIWFDVSDHKLKQFYISSEAFQSLQNVVVTIEPSQEQHHAAKTWYYEDVRLWQSAESSSRLPYPFRDMAYARIAKIDFVARRIPPIALSRKWRSAILVLTDTGYLHCFQLRDDLYPSKDQLPEWMTDAHVDTFAQSAWTPAELQALQSLEALVQRLADEAEAVTPTWSMNVRGMLLAFPRQDSGERLIFEVVQPPAKKLFGREVRHQLRAQNEESLREWAQLLQQRAKDGAAMSPQVDARTPSSSNTTASTRSSADSIQTVSPQRTPTTLGDIDSVSQTDAPAEDVAVPADTTPTATQQQYTGGKAQAWKAFGTALVTKLRAGSRASPNESTSDFRSEDSPPPPPAANTLAVSAKPKVPARPNPAVAAAVLREANTSGTALSSTMVIASPTSSVSSSRSSSPPPGAPAALDPDRDESQAVERRHKPLPPRPNRPPPAPRAGSAMKDVVIASREATTVDDSNSNSLLTALWTSVDVLAEDPADAIAAVSAAVAEQPEPDDMTPLPQRPRVNMPVLALNAYDNF